MIYINLFYESTKIDTIYTRHFQNYIYAKVVEVSTCELIDPKLVRDTVFFFLDNIDTLDSRVRRFFTEARKSKPDQVEEEYKNIHHSYKLAFDNAEEKVSMASQIYDLVFPPYSI